MGANAAEALNFGQLTNPGRHYARAPILEAVLDIHVSPSERFNIQELMQVYVGEEASYPVKKMPMVLQWQVTGGPEIVASATTQTQAGFAFVSADQGRAFQVRRDGFSFNKLKRYEGWEPVRDEARRLWNKYRDVVHPEAVRMLSLRYINRVDLPSPSELKDYFRIYPEIPSEFPQSFDTFALQVGISMPDIEGKLLLNEASVPSPGPGIASVLLDQQIFVQTEGSLGEEEIWRRFEQFRIRKNQVFEACITEQLRERIS